MIKRLENYIYQNYKTATAYAKKKGVSSQFVSAVVRGKKEPSVDMLKDLGLVKIREVTISYDKE